MNAYKIINTISFAAMVLINILANTLPLGGNTTGEVSKAYPTLFTPAPITFSIWSVIYLLMLLFIVYQWGILDRGTYSKEMTNNLELYFTLSCLFNIAWIVSWHYRNIWLSVLFIFGLLFSLIIIAERLQTTSNSSFVVSAIVAGFDIYLGWICVATIANFNVGLAFNNWNLIGIPGEIWTMALILAGSIIGSLIVADSHKWFAALAIIWGYIGILIKHLSHDGYNAKYPLIIATTLIGIVLIIAVMKVVSTPISNNSPLYLDKTA